MVLLVATKNPSSHSCLSGKVEESCGWTDSLVGQDDVGGIEHVRGIMGQMLSFWRCPSCRLLGLAEDLGSHPYRVTRCHSAPQQPPLRDRMLVSKLTYPSGEVFTVLLVFLEHKVFWFFNLHENNAINL